ncbi:hypothetical protein ACJX0J_016862, partial [Zea mays]
LISGGGIAHGIIFDIMKIVISHYYITKFTGMHHPNNIQKWMNPQIDRGFLGLHTHNLLYVTASSGTSCNIQICSDLVLALVNLIIYHKLMGSMNINFSEFGT